jgi:hypothetical protein
MAEESEQRVREMATISSAPDHSIDLGHNELTFASVSFTQVHTFLTTQASTFQLPRERRVTIGNSQAFDDGCCQRMLEGLDILVSPKIARLSLAPIFRLLIAVSTSWLEGLSFGSMLAPMAEGAERSAPIARPAVMMWERMMRI